MRLTEIEGLQEAFNIEGPTVWQSVSVESRPVLFAAAWRQGPRKTLIVAGNYERALAWQAKLELCGVPHGAISQLPSGTSSLFDDAAPEHIALSDRLGALRSLAEGGERIVITSPSAALERTLPKDVLLDALVEVKTGEEIDVDRLIRRFVALGYEPTDPVRIPGQFSRRGGILDVFPTGSDLPIRLELFGDEVESIRQFDPNTQRSVGSAPSLRLVPSRETMYVGDTDFREMLASSIEREAPNLEPDAAARLEEIVPMDADALAEKVYFDRLDLYRPYLHPDSGCAIDLLGDDDWLVLDEPLELEAIAQRAEEELSQSLENRAKRGEILAATAGDFILPAEHLASHGCLLALTGMNALPDWMDRLREVEIQAASLEPYRGRADALAQTLKNYLKEGFRIVFTTDQPNRARSVLSGAEIFVRELPLSSPRDEGSDEGKAATGDERGLGGEQDGRSAPPPTLSSSPDKGSRKSKAEPRGDEEGASGAFLAQGNLGGGFVLPNEKLAFVSDAELFGVARLKLPQRRFSEGAPITTVLDLKPGDHVVHINFGIGIFQGLTKRTVDGVEKEFLFIEYQAPDKLFVPADQLDRVQKYLNPSDTDPKLNKLTGGEWQRTLGKAKEEAKAFARDLVRLYAKRKQVDRRPYGPDTPFQDEMEGTFPYVETRSQMTAIVDAKRDLEAPYPMDRLICGDVGFGKTEVAIRVAFKAVQGTRQVAILCPTTILSEQHYRNFEERLGSFGTKLALVNRYTPPQEKKAILKGLENGEVEMVVGTHALLGQGIKFKDLGLVVIDEEQKFGVKQKEMLKELRTEVDVLTLSATPIPRTLSMALMDIRQMSLINDPPPGRLPIRTYVRPYSAEVIREAILREMARGGQVFYVYNRVESIEHIAEKLRKLVPTARIGVGHGQMHEKELEPIMVGFVKGDIDVLLSTTIVENGIDIANANTLIIEGADKLGLSQLYQLRGRVGRSDRQAYAYFLYSGAFDASISAVSVAEAQKQAQSGIKKRMTVSDGAMQRLQALQEFSSLGSGYSLAFRDLQIRGAGEILGAKQSGTMVSVGYELYTQLINEAVATLKNTVDGELPKDQDVKDPLESLAPLPAFEVPVVALLPEGYIRDQAQRLYYYQRMMSSRDPETLGAVQAEMEDRYGRTTIEVSQAFAIMALRMRARDLGIDKLDARGGRLNVQFKDISTVPPRAFSILGTKNKEAYKTKEALIWPFVGSPMPVIERMMNTFAAALEEVEGSRAALR